MGSMQELHLLVVEPVVAVIARLLPIADACKAVLHQLCQLLVGCSTLCLEQVVPLYK